ncbi:MAG TPA: copper homeostasis protein CutC [Saprospiraceae bacterium]|nr:copper homeostasis protein CutC [Saprospiraceae bacterium]HMP25050.1 copper homeostasis protein CutC [Saprospiraceae bacterium]
MPKTLEICVDSVVSALHAQAGGADRIELCENLAQGGITPSAGKIAQTKRLLTIPVMVLIRPRKGDFLYSDLEFELMLDDIQRAKDLGADGIVSGVLLPDGHIDRTRTAWLVEAAQPLPFTFHRAFDMCREPWLAIGQLAELGVQNILTSGLRATALEGIGHLRTFVALAGERLTIMACSELHPDTIDPLLEIEGLQAFHAALRRPVHSQMSFRGLAPMGDENLEAEFSWHEAKLEWIEQMRQKLQ